MSEVPLTYPDELALLRRLASLVPEGQAAVELGVFRGGSLAAIASVHSPTFGVDTFGGPGTPRYYLPGDGWLEWWERKSGRPHDFTDDERAAREAAPTATIIVADTAETGRRWSGPPVGLLYVDGDHSYEGVSADWRAWRGHMAPGGVVVFDDYRHLVKGKDHYPGVTKLVDQVAFMTDQSVLRVGKAAVLRS